MSNSQSTFFQNSLFQFSRVVSDNFPKGRGYRWCYRYMHSMYSSRCLCTELLVMRNLEPVPCDQCQYSTNQCSNRNVCVLGTNPVFPKEWPLTEVWPCCQFSETFIGINQHCIMSTCCDAAVHCCCNAAEAAERHNYPSQRPSSVDHQHGRQPAGGAASQSCTRMSPQQRGWHQSEFT
jgi:hypothetical protein